MIPSRRQVEIKQKKKTKVKDKVWKIVGPTLPHGAFSKM